MPITGILLLMLEVLAAIVMEASLPSPTLAKPFSQVTFISHPPPLFLLHLNWDQYLMSWLTRPFQWFRLPPSYKSSTTGCSPEPVGLWKNSFGIFTQRCRVDSQSLQVYPDVSDTIVRATCILSNFLHSAEGSQRLDSSEPVEDNGLGSVLAGQDIVSGPAKFCQYFTSGQEPQQYDQVPCGFSV